MFSRSHLEAKKERGYPLAGYPLSVNHPVTLILELESDGEVEDSDAVNTADSSIRSGRRKGADRCIGVRRPPRPPGILVDVHMGDAKNVEDIQKHSERSNFAQIELLLEPAIELTLRKKPPRATRFSENGISVQTIDIIGGRPGGRGIDPDRSVEWRP